MSAFVVSKRHIDALVSFGKRQSVKVWDEKKGEWLAFEKEGDLLGQELINENYKSVNTQYDENEKPYKYVYEAYISSRKSRLYPDLSPVEMLKACACYNYQACACYNYQACESENYESSFAYKIIEILKNHAIERLEGFDDAAWEII